MIVSILIFLLIFSVIVIGHEFGHYAIARKNGIRVLEFDIGFGPVLYRKKRGDTDFCIKLLPFGGACIFDGMNGLTPEDEGVMDEHSFPNANVFARMATVLAGPIANFILGFVFALIIVSLAGTDLPVVQGIMENSAAQEAGIQPGDRIVKINGEHIHIYREVSLASMMNYGREISITFRRNGEEHVAELMPRYDEAAGRYYIGLQGGGEFMKCKGLQIFQYGAYEVGYWAKATYKSLFSMVSGHFSKDDIAGPVGMVKAVDDTYTEAQPYGPMVLFLSFLNLATLLTVNLGIVNLLPVPALDGGRFLFLLVEALRGKPVSPEKEGLVHLAGVALLMVVMVLVLFNDISRFFR